MRILQVAPKVPYPPSDGGRVGIFNITKHLTKRGHQLLLFCLATGKENDDTEKLRRICHVTAVPLNTQTSLLGIIAHLPRSVPYNISKYWSQRVARELIHVARDFRPDVVHIDHLHMARYGLLLKRRLGVPVVLREHNVETVILQRLACQAGSFVGWYLKLQAKRLAMYEARVCRLFDVVATISEEDDRRLQEMAPGVDSIVAPAGVDTSYYTPTLGPEEPNTLVHVGSLEWPPHVHGMKWFLCNVFPLIRRRVPDVKLKLIGKIPPGFQRYAASFPGVIPIGYVEDVRPHVARAAVYVVPLLAGGGIRLKLLEAFAMGKAVVTTSVGTEGIKANHDEHLLIADTPDLFATSVIRLLASPSTRSELGKKARHLVETNYTWDVCIRQLERAYAKALGKSRAERH